MNLVDYLDKDSKTDMINRIKERSKDNILYPKTFEELKELLE